jgi:hypothetical protein
MEAILADMQKKQAAKPTSAASYGDVINRVRRAHGEVMQIA